MKFQITITEEEAREVVLEICRGKNYNFLGFVGKWNGVRTYLKLGCKTDGNIWDTTDYYRLVRGGRCRKCYNLEISKRLSKPDSYFIEMFEEALPNKGYTFKRISGDEWEVFCAVCATDEYAQGGCRTNFKSSRASLKVGQVPCRCGNGTWDKDEILYKLNKLCEDHPSQDIRFVEFHEGFATKYKATFSCAKHGNWKVNIGRFINEGNRCPGCSQGSFKSNYLESYIYILKITGMYTDFVGFGITKNTKRRLNEHKLKLKEYNLTMEDVEIFQCTGEEAREIESSVFVNFTTGISDVPGFKNESVNIHEYDNLKLFIETKLREKHEQNRNSENHFPQ